jgi:SnoaL-like domain
VHKMIAVFAVSLLAAGPAAATDKTDVMAVLHQFVDGFNKGDMKTALAACADQTSIIDEFAPYEWHGTGACATWANAYGADATTNGITDGVVTLGTPRHVDVASDRAYVVAPVNYAFKQEGKPVKEVGSMITVALQKGSAGWRITGWAWSKR